MLQDGHKLVRANKALYDVTTGFRVPAISGKDSMKNDSVRGGRRISIPPTVLFSTIGRIEDVGRAVTMYFKKCRRLDLCSGNNRKRAWRLGVFSVCWLNGRGLQHLGGGEVPKLDITGASATYRSMHAAISAGLLHSSHTPTLGGLAVAFTLPAIGGDLGAEIDFVAARL